MLPAALMMVHLFLSKNCYSDCRTGSGVWANPRAIVAMMRQCNTIDMTRRSPSYEIRLAKYAKRGYEVYVPTLNRQKVDPTVRLLLVTFIFPKKLIVVVSDL